MTFSVVIAWRGSADELRRCLRSLDGQETDQIVVARSSEAEFIPGMAEALPDVEWAPPLDPRDLPELFWGALDLVTGEVVGMLESPSNAGPSWVMEMQAGHLAEPNVLAVGGPVHPPKTRQGWYWSEFAAYTPGRSAGLTRDLTDANVSYKRGLLLAHRDDLDRGHWGWRVRQAAQQESYFAPGAWIDYASLSPLGEELKQHMKRGRRHAVASGQGRLSGLLSVPVLPLVRVCRGWSLAAMAGCGVTYLSAVPGTVLFHVAWAWGEAKGYLTGK